jgi:radical SAM superfamily enzyme YgiQ (UPF0313 family)
MRLAFVNIMQELQSFDSTAYITQPPVPLAVLNAATPPEIETSLIDEQTERVEFDGDVFAFSVSTQNALSVYEHADALRAAGKKVILGGIHITVCPDEAAAHADAIVTGEAETIWPTVCAELLAGTLQERYAGSPTPPSEMVPVDYRFFGDRRYLTPASLFATRGCNRRCSFCVSSRYMGRYRTKPLDVLEREIDQLEELYPGAFLQFTDDNLLASRSYARDLLALLRRKQRRFVTMVTVDQLCNAALVEEMAASGCMAVAVGVESVDDDNCTSVSKYQNLGRSFSEAVRFASERGIQVGALLMVGMPHDTPERLTRSIPQIRRIGCSFYDVRILRIYPSTSMYTEMLASGDVTGEWWLERGSPDNCNQLLPSCLSMDFKHASFTPMELQRMAVRLMIDLNPLRYETASHILRVGRRGRALDFAAMLLAGRHRTVRQARTLLKQVDRAIAGNTPRARRAPKRPLRWTDFSRLAPRRAPDARHSG